MGALATELDPHAEVVKQALEQKRNGNALAFFRLLHILSSKAPDTIAQVLTGLTHFAINLHASSPAVSDLRELVDAALSIDLQACAVPTPDSESTSKHPALDALHIFLVNLVSADATYVEPVLDMFARRAFVLPLDHRLPVMSRVYSTVAAILEAYPRAASLLASILRARYPHPVRPVEEHCSYMRSVLYVARECRNEAVCRSIIAMVFEKLGAIEALVPVEIFKPCVDSALEKEEEVGEELVLTKEAEKMQLVLMELFRHIDLAKKNEHVNFAQTYFEPMFAAYQSSIVPIEGTRFAPYVLLYAASVAGEQVVLDMVERLRHSFFDASMSERLREKFLQHSSAMVIRSAMISPAAAMQWVASIAQWLNRYIDAYERRSRVGYVDIDTDVHHLFYNACCALMMTISRRSDAMRSPGVVGRDPLHQMRLFRIMSCGMNPMLVIPSSIVLEFTEAVDDAGGMDFSDIIEENKGKYTPSRTKYGSRNQFSYTLPCPYLDLQTARAKLQDFIRTGALTEDDVADEDLMETETPMSKRIPVTLANASTPAKMVLSV